MFLGALHLFPSDLFPNMYLLSFFQPHLNYADFHFFVAIVLFGLKHQLNNKVIPNIEYKMFCLESHAVYPCFLRGKFFKKEKRASNEVLTLKNGSDQHFNFRRP